MKAAIKCSRYLENHWIIGEKCYVWDPGHTGLWIIEGLYGYGNQAVYSLECDR